MRRFLNWMAGWFEDQRGMVQLIDEALKKAHVEHFDICLQREHCIGREEVLSKQIARLEADLATARASIISKTDYQVPGLC